MTIKVHFPEVPPVPRPKEAWMEYEEGVYNAESKTRTWGLFRLINNPRGFYPTWITKQGQHIRMDEMSPQHRQNLENMLNRLLEQDRLEEPEDRFSVSQRLAFQNFIHWCRYINYLKSR